MTRYDSGIDYDVPAPSQTPGLPGPSPKRGLSGDDKRARRLQRIADSEGSAPAGAAALDQPSPVVEIPAPGPGGPYGGDPIFKTYSARERFSKELARRKKPWLGPQ